MFLALLMKGLWLVWVNFGIVPTAALLSQLCTWRLEVAGEDSCGLNEEYPSMASLPAFRALVRENPPASISPESESKTRSWIIFINLLHSDLIENKRNYVLLNINYIVCRFSTTANLPPSSIKLSRIIKGVNGIQRVKGSTSQRLLLYHRFTAGDNSWLSYNNE